MMTNEQIAEHLRKLSKAYHQDSKNYERRNRDYSLIAKGKAEAFDSIATWYEEEWL